MKKEMLRVHDLNMEFSAALKLANISFCLMAGECVGFLGLINSGKALLVDMLCGFHGAIRASMYVDGKRAGCMEDIQKYVYRITDSNYLINHWTVADYICLVSDKSFLGIYNRKQLVNKAETYFEEFGLEIDVEQKLKNLSELELRLVDLVKAYSQGAKILVIEDEFEGCSPWEIEHFKMVLDMVIHDRMAAIINSHSDNVLQILSDKYIFFKKGYIVKKCNKDHIKDFNQTENYLLGNTFYTKKKDLDNYRNGQNSTQDIIYSVRGLYLKNKCYDFDFYKGEVVTLLLLDIKDKKQVFELLSGRDIDKYMTLHLERENCKFNNIMEFVSNKIVSIGDMGGKDELLLRMSPGDNLLIPSLGKIPKLQFLFSRRRMVKVLKSEIKDSLSDTEGNIYSMSTNDYIVLLLERWYIYKPKVLVLFEPFVHCDIYSVSVVKSYIKKFTGMGTTVIIVKSRPENVEDITDRIINID